jgi:hypothetical protein
MNDLLNGDEMKAELVVVLQEQKPSLAIHARVGTNQGVCFQHRYSKNVVLEDR